MSGSGGGGGGGGGGVACGGGKIGLGGTGEVDSDLGDDCWTGGVPSHELCLGLGEALCVRLPWSEAPLPPLALTTPPRRFLRRVRLRPYEDSSRPLRASNLLRLFLSSVRIGMRDGSKLNVESSR